jgi:hypothetical protein
MFSIETEARIAKIFLAIIDGEQISDSIRQLLAQQKDFDPFNTFGILDKDNKNYLNEYDILSFFKYYLLLLDL